MADINYPALALACFLFAITPGPGIVAVLALSVSRGVTMGATLCFALVCGDMVYLMLAIVSLASIANALEGILLAVRVVGALYLGWLGIRQMVSPPFKMVKTPINARSVGMVLAGGFMISLTNPKVIVFYLALLPLFLDLTRLEGIRAAIVVAVIFVSVLAGPLLIAVAAGRARDLMTGEVSGRWVNRITGVLLVLVATALVALI